MGCVIAIDPGEKVGWATAEANADGLTVLEYGISTLKEFALAFATSQTDYEYVIYEEYRVQGGARARANIGSTVPTLQLVGMIRLSCWCKQIKHDDGHPYIISQTPGDMHKGAGVAPEIVDREMLQTIHAAMSGPHDDGHHGSALLHLCCWYFNTYMKGT